MLDWEFPHDDDPRLKRVAQHNAVPNRSLRYDLKPSAVSGRGPRGSRRSKAATARWRG